MNKTENTIEIGSTILVDDIVVRRDGSAERWGNPGGWLIPDTNITTVIRNGTILKVVPKKEPQTVESVYREALEKLAKLGNGDQYGNSDGNKIAQEAIAWADSRLKPAPETARQVAECIEAAQRGEQVAPVAELVEKLEALTNCGFSECGCDYVYLQVDKVDVLAARALLKKYEATK